MMHFPLEILQTIAKFGLYSSDIFAMVSVKFLTVLNALKMGSLHILYILYQFITKVWILKLKQEQKWSHGTKLYIIFYFWICNKSVDFESWYGYRREKDE